MDIGVLTSCTGLFDGTTFGTSLGDVSFNGAQLYNVSLSETDLRHVTFSSTNLTGSNLSKSDLSGVDLTSATLTGATLHDADVNNAIVDGVVWSNTTCPAGINSDLIGGTCCGWATGDAIPQSGCIDYTEVGITDTSFKGESLVGAYFVGVAINTPDFENADLTGAHFSEATLTNASFQNADLTYANFENADLSGANFSGATLTNVNFAGATLTYVDLHNADLSTASLTGVVRPILTPGCPAALPADWMCGSGAPNDAGYLYLWGPGVDYSGYDFSEDAFSPDPNVPPELTIPFDASQGNKLNLNGANLSNINGLVLVTNEIGLTATSLTAVGAENFTLRTNLSAAGAGGCVADTAQNGICDGTPTDIDGDGWFTDVEIVCGTHPEDPASNPTNDGLDIDDDLLCDIIDLDDDGDGWSDQRGPLRNRSQRPIIYSYRRRQRWFL